MSDPVQDENEREPLSFRVECECGEWMEGTDRVGLAEFLTTEHRCRVPVQQDEPEAFTTYLPWGIVKLDDVRAWVAENHPGYRFTSNNLCVGEGGERQCVRLVPVQQEPELAARILDPDFADGFVAGARAERAAAVPSVG